MNDDRIVFDSPTITGLQIGTDTLQAGLNGSSFDILDPGVPGFSLADDNIDAQSVIVDWDKIDTYMQNIRSPKAPILDAGRGRRR